MARFSPIRVNYVALYFRDWLPALYRMSTIESGIYIRLVIHIYEAGGRLENKTEFLASISGLSELEFLPHWAKLKSKFVHGSDYLSHERCMIELRKTYKLTEAGKKGAAKRWKSGKTEEVIDNIPSMGGLKGVNSPPLLLNETNTKQNNNKTNTSNNSVFGKVLDNLKPTISDSFSKSSPTSDSSRSPRLRDCGEPHSPQHLHCREHESREGDKLVLYGALQDFFNIRSNADRTSLDNICKWAVNQPEAGRDFYRQVIDLADEAKRKAKTNRWGYFFDVLRRQLGYVPGKIQE